MDVIRAIVRFMRCAGASRRILFASLARASWPAATPTVAHAFLAEALRIARAAAARQQSLFPEFNAEVGRLGDVLDLRRSIVGLRAALWQGRSKENLRRVRDAAQPGAAD